MDRPEYELPPILASKHFDTASAFSPENLLREARRQKGIADGSVPKVCVLDPDGDIVRQLKAEGRAIQHRGWACYHTELFVFEENGLRMGIVGCVVGASFAVLVAEELFASGCELLISVTSSGQISPTRSPPYFILIDKALRDEGTSYHYLEPSDWAEAPGELINFLGRDVGHQDIAVVTGATWTTDAPFRETHKAIEEMKCRGILAVEMEAAALYAFARARGKAVICFAHVTNQMGQHDGDFEKGEANGTRDALNIIGMTAMRLHAGN